MNPAVILWKPRENRSLKRNLWSNVEDDTRFWFDWGESAQIRGKGFCKVLQTNAAQGQPPCAASFVDLSPCLPAARSGESMYGSDSARKERHFYQYRLQLRDSENQRVATPAMASGPTRSRSGL